MTRIWKWNSSLEVKDVDIAILTPLILGILRLAKNASYIDVLLSRISILQYLLCKR